MLGGAQMLSSSLQRTSEQNELCFSNCRQPIRHAHSLQLAGDALKSWPHHRVLHGTDCVMSGAACNDALASCT